MSNSFCCNRCGWVNIYGQGQCINCGQPFSYNCPQCGAYINNTCTGCPNCGMRLLWPGQETAWAPRTTPAPQTEYEKYESPKRMNPVLKGALILAGIIALFAAALITINLLHKPAATTSLVPSSQPSQSQQNAQSTQPAEPSQGSQSAQPGPSQSNAQSSAYTTPDNEFDSAH